MRPDSLEAKFKLLALLPYDSRARRKHMLVFGFILDWYHQKYGDALASVRHIHEQLRERDPDKQGASLSLIHSALSDLVAWGWLTLEKGSGRRASRYVPVWNKLSVHPVLNATENSSSVHPGMNAGVHPGVNTTGISVHPVLNEDPLTGPGHKTGGPVSKPVSAALGGGAGGATPADGFDEIWKAYGRHGNKKASRAAWEAIDWSLYDYGPEHIIERARSWAASAKPGQRRMPLEKWLEAEKFDEADRAIESKKVQAASAEIPEIPTPANDNHPAPRLVTITSSRKEENSRSRAAIFNAVAEDGETIEIYISYEHQWQWAQEAGQQNLVELARAVGIEAFEDTEDFHDIPFLLGQNEAGGHTYLPAPSRAKETSHA